MAYRTGYLGGYSDSVDVCSIPQALFLDGGANDYASTPDSILNSLQGTESILELSGFQSTYADIPGNTTDIAIGADLELRWEGFVDSFITGGAADQQHLISNYNHNVAGLKLYFSTNATTLRFQASTAGSNASTASASSLSPGTRIRIRVLRAFTTGVVSFFGGASSIDWLSLPSLGGGGVVFANTIIPNSATTMRIGFGEGISSFSGRVSNASMIVGGSTVFNPDFSTSPWVIGDVSTQARLDAAGKTWTLRGNSEVVALAERRSFRLSGTSVFTSTPDNAVLDIVGDLDLRVLAALDDWTPTTTQDLCAKFNGTGNQRSWDFKVTTGGNLELTWSADGTNLLTATSTIPTGIADASLKWVRAVLDVDNGAVGRNILFYTSTDGQTWTQLGTTVTQATVTSIFSSSATLDIGGNTSLNRFVTGNIFYAEVRNGIDGTVVANPDFRKRPWAVGATTGAANADRTSRTWTLNATGAIIQRAYASDLDIKVRSSMTDWSPSTRQTFAMKYLSTGNNRSWRFLMNVTPNLEFGISASGTSTGLVSSNASAVTGFTDGSIHWVRVTWRASDGRVQYFTSEDNIFWTQLGIDKSVPTWGIYDGTAPVEMPGGTNEPFNGSLYYAELRNGIDGTTIIAFNPAAIPWTVGDASPTARPDSLGNIFTLFGTAYIIGPDAECSSEIICGGGYAAGQYAAAIYAGAVPCNGQSFIQNDIESNVEDFCITNCY